MNLRNSYDYIYHKHLYCSWYGRCIWLYEQTFSKKVQLAPALKAACYLLSVICYTGSFQLLSMVTFPVRELLTLHAFCFLEQKIKFFDSKADELGVSLSMIHTTEISIKLMSLWRRWHYSVTLLLFLSPYLYLFIVRLRYWLCNSRSPKRFKMKFEIHV